MKNRRLPFGYRMEGGRPVIHLKEAEIVAAVFQQYATGSSYLDLVGTLKNQSVPYDTGRLWNKNMVARILEDSRYLGQAEYPAIIDEGLFLHIAQKRGAKQVPPLTEAQKLLRRLSGQKVSKEVENKVKSLLNTLIENPDRIQQSVDTIDHRDETAKLEASLESLLDSQPIDGDAAQRLIRQIAAAQYEAISPAEYETQRLRYIFTQAEQMDELDIDLLKSAVSQIKIGGAGTVSICLKNNQIIGRSNLP